MIVFNGDWLALTAHVKNSAEATEILVVTRVHTLNNEKWKTIKDVRWTERKGDSTMFSGGSMGMILRGIYVGC